MKAIISLTVSLHQASRNCCLMFLSNLMEVFSSIKVFSVFLSLLSPLLFFLVVCKAKWILPVEELNILYNMFTRHSYNHDLNPTRAVHSDVRNSFLKRQSVFASRSYLYMNKTLMQYMRCETWA